MGAPSLVCSSAPNLGKLSLFILFCKGWRHKDTKGVDLGKTNDLELKEAQLPGKVDNFPTALRHCKTFTSGCRYAENIAGATWQAAEQWAR